MSMNMNTPSRDVMGSIVDSIETARNSLNY